MRLIRRWIQRPSAARSPPCRSSTSRRSGRAAPSSSRRTARTSTGASPATRPAPTPTCMAHEIFTRLIAPSDYLLDLHAGDLPEALEPFCLYEESDGRGPLPPAGAGLRPRARRPAEPRVAHGRRQHQQRGRGRRDPRDHRRGRRERDLRRGIGRAGTCAACWPSARNWACSPDGRARRTPARRRWSTRLDLDARPVRGFWQSGVADGQDVKGGRPARRAARPVRPRAGRGSWRRPPGARCSSPRALPSSPTGCSWGWQRAEQATGRRPAAPDGSVPNVTKKKYLAWL